MHDHDHHDEHIHDHHDHDAAHAHDGVHGHDDVHAHAEDHDHPHDHEHTHIHSHEHTHVGGETHEHTHTHEHEHHHHEHGEGKPMEELLALMKYMTGHNASHTHELEELAREVRHAGQDAAYDEIMEAVRLFTDGNTALSKALEQMQAEK